MIEVYKGQLAQDIAAAVVIEGGVVKVQLELSPERAIGLLVDKLEEAIPGDQTGEAAALKAMIKAKLA